MPGDLPPRPEPPRRWGDAVQAWLAWIGVTRLVVSAISVAVVVAGVAWLVRAPAPTTEAVLPVASGGPAPAVTLAPPSTAAVTAPASPTVVFVHVAGAVESPGVYRLASDDRVHVAIDAAGGPARSAELDGLNLAAPVVDGQRIYVPEIGEIDPAEIAAPPPAASVDGGEPDVANGPIDLNTASAAQLDSLPGIGPATAAAIVDDRERHGPFASVDDLQRVPGIGPAKLAAVVDLVTV